MLRVIVYTFGDEFLACPCFASDGDNNIGFDRFFQQPENLLHGATIANNGIIEGILVLQFISELFDLSFEFEIFRKVL